MARRRRKRSARVIVLPGVERRDLAGSPCKSSSVLQAAIDGGVTDVIVVGRDRQGKFYLAGAPPDMDRTVGMLMRAVQFLAGAELSNDVVIDTSSTE